MAGATSSAHDTETAVARVLYLTFAILVALAGLGFHVLNDQPVELNYFVGALEVQLSWVVVAVLVAGVLLGVLAMSASLLRARGEVKRLSRRNEQVEREVASLRAATLKDAH